MDLPLTAATPLPLDPGAADCAQGGPGPRLAGLWWKLPLALALLAVLAPVMVAGAVVAAAVVGVMLVWRVLVAGVALPRD